MGSVMKPVNEMAGVSSCDYYARPPCRHKMRLPYGKVRRKQLTAGHATLIVSSDGRRIYFVRVRSSDWPQAQSQLVVVQNWFEELGEGVGN